MSKETWQEKFDQTKQLSFRFTTVSDAPIEPLYTPEDVADIDYDRDLGYPGEFPFTRGVHPSMYRGRNWTMRQFAGFGSPKDTNGRFHFLLNNGQTGLSVAFDFPTLYGRDSDDPRCRGEVGKCGVAIDTLRDMEILFDRIPMDQITTSMTINPPAVILWAMYLVVAEKQGVPWEKVGGTIQNDMLKEFIAQKTWIFPPEPSLKIIVDILAFASENVPRWNTISISGYHIREAGSTAVQELAFTLGDGMTYVKEAVKAGLDPDRFAPRLSFFFNSHNDFFEEVAKFRAARRIWSRFMKEEIGAKDPRSWMLRFHTQTAGCSLTAQQPTNNVVRTTIQALAAVMGGTQSLHTNSMDETLALPTENSAMVALRTQQIIAEESGATNAIDPLGGSYFVEALTTRMEREALEYIQRIEEMGGMIKAIERGYPQREISQAAYHYQQQVDAGEKSIVGVNRFAIGDEPPIDTLRIDEQVEREQIRSLQQVRAERDNDALQRGLAALKETAQAGGNLVPAVLDCVRAYGSVGEIVNELRGVFGEYEDPAYL
ncbi:MAG: methylmalonyl-CoA mutase family protein [Candidatus Lernaella stagnicola]|nr:methylmalonyl-CoA mutase family protein [Candidatus Lernaella stagnicola]